MTRLLEKHNVDIQRATKKHKHTHTVPIEFSNKMLEDLLFKSMDPQKLQKKKKGIENLGQKFGSCCKEFEQHSIMGDWYEA